jgi:uncharacterized membrane protein (UPF0127 family)
LNALPVVASAFLPALRTIRTRAFNAFRSINVVKAISAVAACLTLGIGTVAMAQVPKSDTPPATFKQFGQFPEIELSAGLNVIHAEVAANDADREQGLMYRKSLRPNSGMLFVFDDSAGHCFWMENTAIPLSIAFIAEDGTVTDIAEMAAETTNNHCPTRAVRYALEMEKGWFAQHGVTPGMQIKRMGTGQ